MSQLDTIYAYMSNDDKFYEKMEKASLMQIAAKQGIAIDKMAALTGKNTQHIEVTHQQKVDEILPALLTMLQQRGLPAPPVTVEVEK